MGGVRWEALRADRPPDGELPLGLPDPPLDRGSGRAGLLPPPTGPIIAGTPDAVAIEIQARSIINRVPGASQMPFEWTINPYRGCTHACAYCVSSDTPILMADGRTRPISDLRVGDEIYGTKLIGRYRRYVRNRVIAHWSTVKPAYRTTLEDGTELITSGDHRFLTKRGWKYVVGRMSGTGQRPYLTQNNKLMGTGKFAHSPKDTEDYRRGYLCGMIRGDGTMGSYVARRTGNKTFMNHSFRLALADGEALERSWTYLTDFGVPTWQFLFQKATETRREVQAIRTYDRSRIEAIADLIQWPRVQTEDWIKGFLAGVFDAEGSCSRGVLRITNTKSEIIECIALALDRLGFTYVIEDAGRDNGLRRVRLLGGLRERMRFFHLIDPAITRKLTIDGMAVKGDAKLKVMSIEPLGLSLPMFDITTETGDFIANGVVSHNCFARNTHTYLDLDAGHDFDSKIVVKVNAGELLRKELASPRWRGDPIAMGTNVDCYQRVEGRYRLMRQIIGTLRDFANPFSILTKGTLIGRDLDLLTEAAAVTDVSVAFSVGFVDDGVWREVEPGTPAPARRLDMVRRFVDAGLRCSVLMAPILPGLTDDEDHIDRTVAAIVAAGARSITPLVLHLRPGAREWYAGFLTRTYPELVPRYRQLYRAGAYAPKAYQREVAARVRQAARRHGLRDAEDAAYPERGFRRVGPEPEQVVAQPRLV